jgi:hypothetical protein
MLNQSQESFLFLLGFLNLKRKIDCQIIFLSVQRQIPFLILSYKSIEKGLSYNEIKW